MSGDHTRHKTPGALRYGGATQPDATYPVLVVADDVALRKVLRRLFSAEGFEVEVVTDGRTALELLRQRSFSAVVLDLKHPVSSERDLCGEIADVLSDAPFVLLSASSDIADRRLLLGTGADDYLTMPFSPKELVTRMGKLLRRMALAARENSHACEYTTMRASNSEITRLEDKVNTPGGKGETAISSI
jgi:DNA-binding response OmpR family regulator